LDLNALRELFVISGVYDNENRHKKH